MEQVFGAISEVVGAMKTDGDTSAALVFAAWSRSAGDLLNERTAPIEFVGNKLTVAVQDKTWQRHLEELSRQMLAKVNGLLGAGSVKFIEFRVAPTAIKAKRDQESEENADVSTVSPSLVSAADAIVDADLRSSFLSTASVYLARQRRMN